MFRSVGAMKTMEIVYVDERTMELVYVEEDDDEI